MRRALEEVVAHNLDDLYVGALHLTGGDRARAEGLLLRTVSRAATRFRASDAGNAEAFLEGLLVRTFLDRAAVEGPGTPHPGPHGKLDVDAEPEEVLRWMGTLPPSVRCTIWLVVVRRRSYREVGETLGIDRDAVAAWVRDGHERLFRAGARASLSGDGGR